MSETLELIKARISANMFDKTRALTADEIRELVSYATEAPSAYNIQPWR
ncbi:MAG: nitroreductase family protein, partial [Acidobacteriota bacterium]